MIEMRHLKRRRQNLPPAFNALSENAWETVLQYRYYRPEMATYAPAMRWSEWKDVPTVSEDEADAAR